MKLMTATLFLLSLLLGPHALSADPPADNSTPQSEPATTTPANAETIDQRAEPDPDAQRSAALAQAQSPDTEVIWLDSEGTSHLALYQPTGSADSHGGLLILHDRETSPDWPDLVHPLRTQLTNHGWNTLSISLPDPSPRRPPKRTAPVQTPDTAATNPLAVTEAPDAAAGEPEANTATETSVTAVAENTTYPAIINRLIQTASEQLSNKGHTRQVIIGIGEGAVWAAAFVVQATPERNLRLIMIDPSQPENVDAPQLLALIPELNTTVLDLYFSARRQQVQSAERRKRTALRHQKQIYKQFKINPLTDDRKRQQQWLTRQVRGVLQTHIIKADMKKAVPETPPVAHQLTPGS